MSSFAEKYYTRLTSVERLSEMASEHLEGQHLDYKGALDRNKKNVTRKVAIEVCAFANSEGGVVVIGIDDKTRSLDLFDVPDRSLEDLEIQVARLIEPKPQFELKSIVDEHGSGAIAILVPPSYTGPHSTAYWTKDGQNNSKARVFYRRSGSESAGMDHGQIKDMFGRRLHPKLSITGKLRKVGRTMQTSSEQTEWGLLVQAKNVGHASARDLVLMAFGDDIELRRTTGPSPTTLHPHRSLTERFTITSPTAVRTSRWDWSREFQIVAFGLDMYPQAFRVRIQGTDLDDAFDGGALPVDFEEIAYT